MRPALAAWVAAPAVVALAGFAGAGPARADCGLIDQAVRQAMQAGEVERYPGLLARAQAEATCSSAYRGRLARVLALSAYRKLTAGDRSPSVADLEKAAALATPWQVMISLGDAYYDARNYSRAFRAYEACLDDMRDETANPGKPPADLERHAYLRAIEARALNPTFLASRSVRGVPAGLASPKFRNFTAEAVPVPVRFAFDSADLTSDGIAAAKEILTYLEAAGHDRVALIGHTDTRGSAQYNLELSLRRAAAVRDYLIASHYGGQVDIVGRGESEPFRPDDPTRYSEDELDAMSRRVEYRTD